MAIGGSLRAQETQPASQATQEIPRVPFGKGGLQVPVVCFGAMGIRANNGNVLRAGVQSGLVMIDTALGYGQGESERVVGDVIKAFGRDKVMLHTKASGFPQGNLLSMSDQEAYDALRKLVDQSLSRLGGDYIDTYVCPHGASDPAVVTAAPLRAAVEKLKAEGKIKYFGISTHQNYVECSMAAINSGWHDFVMVSLAISNLDPDLMAASSGAAEAAGAQAYEQKAQAPQRRRSRRNQTEDMRPVLKAAQEKGVGILAMKGVQFVPGNLMSKIREKYAPEGSNLSDQQICYRAVMTQPGVSLVTVGIQSMKHLEEALALPTIQLKTA